MSNVALAVPAEVAEHKAAQEQYRGIADMLARSATDSAFRQLMLTDAHAAFAQFGLEVPKALDVVFIENTHDMTIVLPESIDELSELNEIELSELNGGSWTIIVTGAEIGTSTSFPSALIGLVASAVIASVVYTIAR